MLRSAVTYTVNTLISYVSSTMAASRLLAIISSSVFSSGLFDDLIVKTLSGGYVDRGKRNVETICLLLVYKVLYKENFFLLRGNHECAAVNRIYGFYDEYVDCRVEAIECRCQRRYSIRLWRTFQDVFNCMPFCALVAGKILCMHGGLSPAIESFEQLRTIRRPVLIRDISTMKHKQSAQVKPTTPSMLIDLLWADPDKYTRGWQVNTRGVSYTFGYDVVFEFCQRMDIDLIARAHQIVRDGYEFFAGRRLVTVFR